MTYQTEIEEAVIATYPVDLFPDNETAKAMRKMAPAIASIVLPVIERAVATAIKKVRDSMPSDHSNIDERVAFYAACNELEKALTRTK